MAHRSDPSHQTCFPSPQYRRHLLRLHKWIPLHWKGYGKRSTKRMYVEFILVHFFLFIGKCCFQMKARLESALQLQKDVEEQLAEVLAKVLGFFFLLPSFKNRNKMLFFFSPLEQAAGHRSRSNTSQDRSRECNSIESRGFVERVCSDVGPSDCRNSNLRN